MSDPTSIDFDQIRAAYRGLGLDPERIDETVRVVMAVHDVEVVRETYRGRERLTGVVVIPTCHCVAPAEGDTLGAGGDGEG